MLLELYDRNHKKLANLTGIKSPHIQRTLEYGDETLDFSYPTSGPWLAQLLAECYIRTDRQEYVVKAVEKSSTSAWRKVSCALNIEELEGAPFEGFETVEQTVQAAAEFALEGTGWTVEADADITKKRTIRKEDDTTAWEVVKQIVTAYRVELEIDAVNKRLKFHTRRGQDRGAYFIERLNLRSLGVKTSSYGFYTRLIPIGKDGLHLWRDGQNYIENHQYSDKVITSIWRDERYTVTAALLEDAQARLDEASTPARAYTAELVDLAAQSNKYNTLAYDLGDAVLLVSEKTDEREKQRIVKLDEYPDDPLANKAELSNVKQTFAQLQKTEAEMATADAVAIATKRTKKVLKDDYLTKKETEVKISALAESIELEVSKTYMTVANGQAAIDKALEAGKQYTDGKLTEYSTTEETKSLISQSAEQITLEVSKTYATQGQLDDYTKTSEVRSRFAMDASSVTIDAGRLTFNSNTIVINSTNFKLDASGNVTASGTFKSASGKWEAVLRSGGLFMSYDGNRRIELFKAANYDGGFLKLYGILNGKERESQASMTGFWAKDVEKNQLASIGTNNFQVVENGNALFYTAVYRSEDGSYSQTNLRVRSPDESVYAELRCQESAQVGASAHLAIGRKSQTQEGVFQPVFDIAYQESLNRVTIAPVNGTELYINKTKF